eukprot:6202958-Pleurochrysis_carterae.AAC.1
MCPRRSEIASPRSTRCVTTRVRPKTAWARASAPTVASSATRRMRARTHPTRPRVQEIRSTRR